MLRFFYLIFLYVSQKNTNSLLIKKFKSIFLSAAAAGILTGCAPDKGMRSDKTAVVDVASAIDNPTSLTTSQLGGSISYVPLETTDSSLIGNRWTMSATDDKLIVSNFSPKRNIMVFDLRTGKFLNTIGQAGNGPEEYMNPYHVVDPSTGRIYISASTGKGYLTYDTEGNFKGHVMKGFAQNSPLNVVSDSLLIFAEDPTFDKSRSKTIRTFDAAGNQVDTALIFKNQSVQPIPDSFDGPTDYKRYASPFRHSMYEYPEVENNGNKYIFTLTRLYPAGKETHLREYYCDTIYRLIPGGVEPAVIFDMGEHTFSVSDVNRRIISNSHIILTDIVETPEKVIFGVSKGWMGDDDHKEYIGIHDLTSGQTFMTGVDDGIKDDLGNFMPFSPLLVTPGGAVIGVLLMDDIENWMEENPGAQRPEWLDRLHPEANPILVIIQP